MPHKCSLHHQKRHIPLHTFFGLRLLDMLGAFSKIYDFVESHCLDDYVVGSLNLEGNSF